MIFHLALAQDWADAVVPCHYDVSTRGVTLAEQGFIHASKDSGQTRRVRETFYSDVADLVVAHFDEGHLVEAGFTVRMGPSDLRDEQSERFPHIYGGPLPTVAVIKIMTFIRHLSRPAVIGVTDTLAQCLFASQVYKGEL